MKKLSSCRVNKTAPKLGAIDLNLLVVFDAIMRDRSVTRAGLRLRLSQPAMSHALTRLRHMLKDELFVRSPSGMVPTPPQLQSSSAKFGADFVDGSPASLNPALKPAMRAPFLSAAQILATSDLVSVLPLNVAKPMTRSHQLVYRRLSRSPKPIEAAMIWLRRLDNQPAHARLRDVIGRVTGDLQDTLGRSNPNPALLRR